MCPPPGAAGGAGPSLSAALELVRDIRRLLIRLRFELARASLITDAGRAEP